MNLELLKHYTFTEDGTILSPKGKELTYHYCKKGYARVNLKDARGKKRTYLVHRLIALTHIPNPEGKPQVNHCNGDKKDNKVTNLEWVTNQENTDHAMKTGLIPRGSDRPNSKLSDSQVIELRGLKEEGWNYYQLGKKFNIAYQSAHKVATRQTYTHI
jgi:hypothetical protein